MAESYGFFNDNSGDRTYLDDALAAPFGALAGSPGVAPFITDALKPSIGTGLEVKIAPGFAFGGELPGWWYRSTAETSNILDATESGKKRIDLITLCFDRNTEQRTVTRKVIQGIETTGEPIEPSLTQNETLYELAIAAVKVDDSDILLLVDKRNFIKAGRVIHNNRLINSDFNINQRVVSGTVTLTAGEYGHDQWKAGASGCTYTFAAADNITTLTITAGSLIQVVEGLGLVTDEYTLSWKVRLRRKLRQAAMLTPRC